jgi:hypothetical protein
LSRLPEISPRKITFSVIREAGTAEVPALDDSAPEVWRDKHGAVCARATISQRDAWMDFPGVAAFRFDPENCEVTAFAQPEVDLEQIRDTYYRAVLPHALNFFGREVLHASAVRTERGVVAFCAISETGKSTTAAGLRLRGYPMWADDAVGFEVADGDPITQTFFLPFRLRLCPASAEFLKHSEKFDGWPDADSGGQVSAPLATVCVLTRTDQPSRRPVEIRLMASAEAFTAIIPHAYCFTLSDLQKKRRMMQHYMDLAARTPTFAVSIASGMQRLPEVLDAIERSLPAFASSGLQIKRA